MLPPRAASAPRPHRSSNMDMLGDCWAAAKNTNGCAWGGCFGSLEVCSWRWSGLWVSGAAAGVTASSYRAASPTAAASTAALNSYAGMWAGGTCWWLVILSVYLYLDSQTALFPFVGRESQPIAVHGSSRLDRQRR